MAHGHLSVNKKKLVLESLVKIQDFETALGNWFIFTQNKKKLVGNFKARTLDLYKCNLIFIKVCHSHKMICYLYIGTIKKFPH